MMQSLHIFKHYKMSEILKSVLISFLFFAIPASIIILGGIQTILLMVPHILSGMFVIYVLLLLTLLFSTKILVDTLKNYTIYNEIDYKLLYWVIYCVMVAIITIIEIVVLFLF